MFDYQPKLINIG